MLSKLSPRERQIAELAAMGLTDGAIRTKLSIGPGTLNTYWSRIRSKLGGMSRYELVKRIASNEMSMQLESLRVANAALQERLAQLLESGTPERSLFALAVENAPDGVLIIDIDGIVVYSNDTACALLGFKSTGLSGRHIRTLIPERFHGWHSAQRVAYMDHPSKRLMGFEGHVEIDHADGREIRVAISMNALDAEHVVCLIREHTWQST